jgi:hypothetical protein
MDEQSAFHGRSNSGRAVLTESRGNQRSLFFVLNPYGKAD